MRRTLVLLVLLAGCVSRDGIIDERVLDCSAGQDLSIDVAINLPKVMTERTTDVVTVFVTVGNNSNRSVQITGIRVEPGFTAQSRYAIDNIYAEFDKVLEPGDDEEFELPIWADAGSRTNQELWPNAPLEVIVDVYLAGGDNYRCSYEVPSPR